MKQCDDVHIPVVIGYIGPNGGRLSNRVHPRHVYDFVLAIPFHSHTTAHCR